ncbi:major facilitator superfamily domain-containing protein [Collybia nuda]|uniref:Major facilitator superfamily domain-containing protein n=1 Tax=Collybia nuda TaxID=64659 RepID=A0A9P5XZA5_9AGAR|nr:major facilitator superfamily domain-containing protein [Collybia nuda]
MVSHDLESESEKTGVRTPDPEKRAKECGSVGQPEVDFPEGGWRAWLVVLGVWLGQFSTFGYTNAYGVYNDFYVRDYLKDRYTSSQISWIGSTQLFLTLSLGLVSGRGFDTGYFYHLVFGGYVLMIFCMFMVSITQPGQYYQLFLSQGLGVGIAVGISYVPSYGLLAHYFKRRRATAMGIAASGSAIGGAVHPIMLNQLFHGRVGFHAGVRASAGLLAGLLTISFLLLRPRLPFTSRKQGSTLINLRTFLRDPPYVFMVIGTALVLSGLYFPIFFLQLHTITNGLDSNFAFYTLVMLNGASALGRILPNMLATRIGVFNVIVPCVAASAILVYCSLAIKDVAGTIIFALLYGFFSGACNLLPPMIGSLAEKDTEIGARMGICFTFTGFGGLVGTPIAGALLSTSFIWWRPVLFAGLCVTFGALCFTMSRFLASRQKGTQWL